jgi:hypothetical protein
MTAPEELLGNEPTALRLATVRLDLGLIFDFRSF